MGSWAKAVAVFARENERLDHLRIHRVSIELVQLRQPEVIARVIRVLRVIRVASQVAEVLHQHKGPVGFLRRQRSVLRHLPQ